MRLTGRDLLNKLSILSEEELSRPVYVYADHGQEYYSADTISVDESTISYEYCLEDHYIHSSDIDGSGDTLKFICIS